MVTLNKPSAGDTSWTSEVNANWTDLENAVIDKTDIDAKGDILAGTAADTITRLAVGSNDQVLTADSSTSTGLKWATGGGGVSFNPKYPDGTPEDATSLLVKKANYTVTTGKNLFITFVQNKHGSNTYNLTVDSIILWLGTPSTIETLDTPLMVASAETVTLGNTTNNAWLGFEVNEGVSPLIKKGTSSYTVTTGKTLYIVQINNAHASNAYNLTIDSVAFSIPAASRRNGIIPVEAGKIVTPANAQLSWVGYEK